MEGSVGRGSIWWVPLLDIDYGPARVVEAGKWRYLLDVLSLSHISKDNARSVFIKDDSSFIAVKETERTDLTSRFI